MNGIRQVDLENLGGEGEGKREGEDKRTKKDRERAAQGERNLGNRLRECFDRIADSLEQRGDRELADIIREDSQVMAGGLISLTRPLKPIRTVVVLFLAIVEPVLAFGRVLRVLAVRWSERRAEAARQAAETETAQPPFPSVT